MSPAIDLAAMTEAEKDALILSLRPLVGQLEAALARIAVLEARIEELTRPPKTPDNSSTPPSKSAKPEKAQTSHPISRPEPILAPMPLGPLYAASAAMARVSDERPKGRDGALQPARGKPASAAPTGETPKRLSG